MMAAETGSRRERHAATRERILESAWDIAREQGLAAMSLRELAARVGMRAPSLYSYFPSKSAIYDAMFSAANAELLALVEPVAADRRRSAASRVRRGARVWAEFCCADPVRFALLYQRTIPGFEPSQEAYALAGRVISLLAEGLAEAGRSSRRDVDLYTAYLSGLAAQQIANDPGGDRWSRLVDDTVLQLLDGIPTAKERT
jgi:AcrR family transcriptional regulator